MNEFACAFSTDEARYEKIFAELQKIYGDESLDDEEQDLFSVVFLSFVPFLIPGLINTLPTKKIMNQIILDLKNYTDTRKDDGNAGFRGAKAMIDDFAGFISNTSSKI